MGYQFFADRPMWNMFYLGTDQIDDRSYGAIL